MAKKRWFQKYTDLVRASKLQRLAAAGLVVLALISLAQSNLLVVLQKQIDLMLSAVLPGVIVELTNEERVTQNLGNLTRNPVLDEAARLKAMHMRAEGYFDHWSPEGVSPWFWFDQAGYNYVHAGENLAIYFDESEDVVQAWMESPLHKENILRPEYTEIGVAAIEGEYEGYDTVFIVQLFGTPAVPQIVAGATQPATAITTRTTVLAAEEEPTPVPEIPAVTTVQPEEPMVAPSADDVTPERVADVSIVDATPEEVLEEPTPTPVSVITVGNSTVYVSDHAATTSEGAVAAQVTPTYQTPERFNIPRVPAGEARNVLQMLYALVALVVGGLIASSMILASRHMHHTQVAYGAHLFVALLALTGAHSYFVHIAQAAL